MFKRILVTTALFWVFNAQALDLGGILNNVIDREMKRQNDSGATGGMAAVFKSISEAVVGVNNPNVSVQGAKPDQVIMYATSTCGYCAAARKYMQAQGISYLEKDIGRDPAARAELKTVDDRGGVPVLLMGKYKLVGFEEVRFNQTYAKFQADLKGASASVNAPGAANTSGFNTGDVLTARIAKVKVQGSADGAANPLAYLAKNEEVIFMGESKGNWLKVRTADYEGWVEKALMAKP